MENALWVIVLCAGVIAMGALVGSALNGGGRK